MGYNPLARAQRDQLSREYEEASHGFLLGIPVIVGIVLTLAAVGWLTIWLVTASSGPLGNANVTRQHNSGQNQVNQNTKLLGDQATVLSDQQRIKVLAADVKTEQDRMDLSGLEQNCAADVAAYNADVQNILAAGYLPAGLPSSYPATVCDAPAT